MSASATLVTFNVTGRLTVVNSANTVADDGTDGYTPISAQLIVDDTAFTGATVIGAPIGASTLTVNLGGSAFFGPPATIHDMSLSFGGVSGGRTIVYGNFFIDWNDINDMPAQVEWDATGLAEAANYRLQVGDVISGDTLSGNRGNGYTQLISSLGSAAPFADTLDYTNDVDFPDFLP